MKLERACIIDTETTGLDPLKDQTVEIGAILYSIPERSIIAQVSYLLAVNTQGIEWNSDTHGITKALIDNPVNLLGTNETNAILDSMLVRASILVGHNLDFDLPFLDRVLQPRWGKGISQVCTLNDFEWPKQSTSKSLISIAVAHGVSVVKAHRALTDCQLIADCFDRVGDLEARLTKALRPKALFEALVSYDDREMAKSQGFRWKELGPGWRRWMAIEDAPNLGFRTRRVEQDTDLF